MTVTLQNTLPFDDASLSRRGVVSQMRRMLRPRIWHLLVPVGLVFGVVYLVPLLNIVRMSVEGGAFFGAKYWELVNDDIAMIVLWRTIGLALATATLCLIIGYPIAYLLHLTSASWQRVLMSLVLLPLWISVLVRTFSWVVVLGREGLVNRLLLETGLIHQPLALLYNRFGTLVGCVQIMLPYFILPVFSSMSRFDRRLDQAASVLGAGPFAAFLLIFVPLSLSGVFTGFLIVFIATLGLFVTPALLGGVRDTTFVMLIYQNVNESHDWNMAAAMAMLLLAATTVLALMSRWLFSRERTGTAAPRAWQHWLFLALVTLATAVQRNLARRPKQPRRPAAASAPVHDGLRSVRAIGSIFLVLSVLPLLVLIPMSLTNSAFISFPPPAYSLRWYLNFLDRWDWYMPAVRSLLIALAAMGLSTLLGACAALAVSRLHKGTAVAYAIILSPMVVPTVVFALALYLSFAKVGLIGTYAGIVLGHTILAVPYVFIVMNSALASVDMSLENAAQVLGAGPIRAFAATTLPLIAPAILSAALFAFLVSFDDIIIALFISDAQTTTLPKRMWEGIRFEIDPTSVAVSVILLSGSLLLVGIAELVRGRARRLQRSSKAIEYIG